MIGVLYLKDNKIIESISKRGNGEIYLGVVGAVRTGKSTFIKRFIENLVVPNITDEYEKKHCLDEIPQSAQGKTIMTTEPKFVPSNGAKIKVDEFETNIKLIDCVGYIIPGSNGYEDENGNPRMVLTPWFKEPVNFETAAEIGTEKVIKDHATIGIVVTSDGSFGEIPRENYLEAEQKVIRFHYTNKCSRRPEQTHVPNNFSKPYYISSKKIMYTTEASPPTIAIPTITNIIGTPILG